MTVNMEQFGSSPNMRATEIVDILLEAGFTTEQALGLTGVITAIRAGRISREEAEHYLEKTGFPDKTAEQLIEVFFRTLAAAA